MAADILARGLAAAARAQTLPVLARFADLPTRAIPAPIDRLQAGAGPGSAKYVCDSQSAPALAAACPRFCKADAVGRYFRLLPDADGMIPLSSAKDSADLDDTPALMAAHAYAAAVAAKGVKIDTPAVALKADQFIEPLWPDLFAKNVVAGSRLDARGAVITAEQGSFFGVMFALSAYPTFHSRHTITAALAAGDMVIRLDTVAGLAAGDWVLGRMGDNADREPLSSILTQVDSVDTAASAITLKAGVEYAFSAAALAAAAENKFFWKVTPITDEIRGDIHVISPGPSNLDQQAVVIYGGVAPHINSLRVQGAQTGALILGMTRGARVDHFYVRDAYSNSANLGYAFRCSESDVVFGTGVAENCRSVFFAETDSYAHFQNLTYRNSDTTDRALFFCGSGSRITVDRLRLYGRGGYRLFDFSDNVGGPVSSLNVCNLEIRGELPANLGTFGREIREELIFAQPGQPRETYHIANKVTRRYRIPLKNDANRALFFVPPQTLLTDVRVYASPGVTAGSAYVSITENSVGFGIDLSALIVPGTWQQVGAASSAIEIGTANAMNSLHRGAAKAISWGDTGAGGADLTGQFLIVEVSYIYDSEQTSASDSAFDAASSGKLYWADSFDPPSLAAGTTATATMFISGAVVGDRVEVAFDQPLQGVSLNAWVDSPNILKVQFINETGGTLDLASGMLQAWVHVADVS